MNNVNFLFQILSQEALAPDPIVEWCLESHLPPPNNWFVSWNKSFWGGEPSELRNNRSFRLGSNKIFNVVTTFARRSLAGNSELSAIERDTASLPSSTMTRNERASSERDENIIRIVETNYFSSLVVVIANCIQFKLLFLRVDAKTLSPRSAEWGDVQADCLHHRLLVLVRSASAVARMVCKSPQLLDDFATSSSIDFSLISDERFQIIYAN